MICNVRIFNNREKEIQQARRVVQYFSSEQEVKFMSYNRRSSWRTSNGRISTTTPNDCAELRKELGNTASYLEEEIRSGASLSTSELHNRVSLDIPPTRSWEDAKYDSADGTEWLDCDQGNSWFRCVP